MDMQEQNNLKTQLISDMGLENLPMEKQEALLMRMMEVVLKRIFVETIAKLSEKDGEEYMAMIEKNMMPEELEAYVREKIPRYEELVLEVTRQFREEMVDA
ncbi:MAG: DUF5663 domain-containing protein [Parcubacteria group bacterium]|jgi:hypothetical protein